MITRRIALFGIILFPLLNSCKNNTIPVTQHDVFFREANEVSRVILFHLVQPNSHMLEVDFIPQERILVDEQKDKYIGILKEGLLYNDMPVSTLEKYYTYLRVKVEYYDLSNWTLEYFGYRVGKGAIRFNDTIYETSSPLDNKLWGPFK